MFVIGVAGGSGSGKTTFVRSLGEELRKRIPIRSLSILEQDVYYYDQGHLPMEERRRVNYDEPASIEFPLIVEHIRSLKLGNPVDVPVYDVLSMTRQTATLTLHPADILVVEGILILCDDALRRELDFSIYLQTDPDTRLARIIERDGRERGRDESTVRDRVENTVEPMHRLHVLPSSQHADWIVSSAGDFAASVRRLLELIGEGE